MDYFELLEIRKKEALLAASAYVGLKNEIEDEIRSYLVDKFSGQMLFLKSHKLYFKFKEFKPSFYLHDFFDGELVNHKQELLLRIHIEPIIEPSHKHYKILAQERNSLSTEQREEYNKVNPVPYYFEYHFEYDYGLIQKIVDYDFRFKVNKSTLEIVPTSQIINKGNS